MLGGAPLAGAPLAGAPASNTDHEAGITVDVSITVPDPGATRTHNAAITVDVDLSTTVSAGQTQITLRVAPVPSATGTVLPPKLTLTERPASLLDSICSNWTSTEDLAGLCATELDAEIVQQMLDTAVEWLNDLTCNQYGGSCLYDLRVSNHCHHGGGHCGSNYCDWDRIDLTRYLPSPVTTIAEVQVNGEVVPSTDYRLDDRRWFVPIREGALIPWPTQDMQQTIGETGTWKITAYAGQEPPRPLVLAAQELACQLIRKWETGDCDLPDNTTSVTRDGVTISLQARQEGRIGLPTVDAVLDTYPCRKKRRMPDPGGRRSTSIRIP